MQSLKISKAQILALLAFAATQAVALGWITNHTEKIVLGIAGIVLPAIWMIADAIIHHSAAKISVASLMADVHKLEIYIAHNLDPVTGQPKPTQDPAPATTT